jgi:hypothetical protein
MGIAVEEQIADSAVDGFEYQVIGCDFRHRNDFQIRITGA